MKRVLFLYVELSGYMVACLNRLANSDVEVHVVHYAVSCQVPYVFEFSKELHLYSRESLSGSSLNRLSESISPDVIFCSGWVDKGYLSVVRRFSGRCKTALILDTIWDGRFRQIFGSVFFKYFIKPWFSDAWAPSELSFNFLKRLGFPKNRISYNLYCADDSIFNSSSLPDYCVKRFLFAGRLVPDKGIDTLLGAFLLYCKNSSLNIQLDIFGYEKERFCTIENIVSRGFLQPSELAKEFKKGGVLVLPSRFEPWGVVVQEALNCGIWVIASDQVGSAKMLIKEGINGTIFQHNNIQQLCDAMAKVEFCRVNNGLIEQQFSLVNWVLNVKSFC